MTAFAGGHSVFLYLFPVPMFTNKSAVLSWHPLPTSWPMLFKVAAQQGSWEIKVKVDRPTLATKTFVSDYVLACL